MESSSVVRVDKSNLAEALPRMAAAVDRAAFVSVDTEFTGLSRSLRQKNVQDRYTAYCEHVRSRSLLQIGVCCYIATETGDAYDLEVFNIFVVRKGEFTVSANAMAFLAGCGLDLNDVFLNGARYYPEEDNVLKPPKPRAKPTAATTSKHEAAPGVLAREAGDGSGGGVPTSGAARDGQGAGQGAGAGSSTSPATAGASSQPKPPPPSLKTFFQHLGRSGKPLVVHNGLLDLVFLYHAYLGALPKQSATFSDRLVRVFPTVFDTKWIAEQVLDEPVSYLSYLYHSSLRAGTVTIPTGVLRALAPPPAITDSRAVCDKFAFRGFCQFGDRCRDSHNMDAVVDFVQRPTKRRRIGVEASDAPTDVAATPAGGVTATVPTTDAPNPTAASTPGAPSSKRSIGAHSGAFDAFATGLAFATYMARDSDKVLSGGLNKLFLMGKSMPFTLRPKPTFAARPVVHGPPPPPPM